MALINMKKIASSEVGKGAVGNFFGNLLTDGIKSVGIFLAIVCVVMVPVLLLFFKKSILTQEELAELCKRVKSKRDLLLPGERFRCDRDLLSDAESLRKNWLNRKLYSRLCERIRAKNDLDALLEELPKVYLAFGALRFWTGWDAWCRAGSDVAKPAVGIDTRAEDREPEYEEKSKAVLVAKIVDHFSDWRKRFRPNSNHIFVKWIGANDVALVADVLRGFAKVLSQEGEIHVWLPRDTVTDDNSANLEKTFSAEDDGVTIENSTGRDDGYDVVISRHFWQHHSVNVVNHEKLELRKSGLFVLLAAIARDPKDDEYVCEGCMPMRATVFDSRNQVVDGIPFRPMGVYSDRQSVISYKPIVKYERHAPVLSWGFPKAVSVDKSVVCDDGRLAEWILEYFQWGKKTEAADFLRMSGDGMVKQPSVTLERIQILARSRAVDGDDTISEYLLMELEYCVDGASGISTLPFIVCVGYEKNEWGFAPTVNKTPITFHPAIEINQATLRKGRSGLLELVLMDAGQDRIMRRYGPYIPNSPCADSDGCSVWRIHTRIYEADLNDLLVFEDKRGGRRAFYSYFPKRRYLTERGYELGLKMLDNYKTWAKKLRGESNVYCGSLLRFDSVTWLWSYQHMLRFCKDWNLRIDDPRHDLYFHKTFCALTDKDAAKARLVLRRGPSPMPQRMDLLFDATCSVDKDNAFNELPVDERVKMLACLNVHNILLFARNCDVE